MFFHALTFAKSRGRCWKPRSETAVFNTSQGTLRMLIHWKNMFERYYCVKLKTFATFRVISCTILFRLITDISRTQFARTMLVLGPGSTHFVTAANLWPLYGHMKVASPCINSAWIALLIHGFSPFNARLLITCDIVFLCNNVPQKKHLILLHSVWLFYNVTDWQTQSCDSCNRFRTLVQSLSLLPLNELSYNSHS